MIQLVHMTEATHKKNGYLDAAKTEHEHSFYKITAKTMRHADKEIG